MCNKINSAKSLLCDLIENSIVNNEYFILSVSWNGKTPKAGQFFMVRPQRSSYYLGRPISVFGLSCEPNTSKMQIKFLIAKRGKGTEELSQLKKGEKIEMIGPLGNAWADFLPPSVNNGKKVALVGGGVGIAPLSAFFAENPQIEVHVYAGFKNSLTDAEEVEIIGDVCTAKKLVVSAEYGMSIRKGRIVDFFDNDSNIYGAVFCCGPEPMMKAVKEKCESANIPCFVSLERRMACGVGACLGCTVQTAKGNSRCCADGPIFDSKEYNFD